MRFIDSPVYKYNGTAEVQVCVLHHTAGGLESALATLWGGAEVSINFLIAKNGDIFYGVRMGKRAWHCGRSQWQGWQDAYGSVNGLSIGIELVNRGDHVDPYPLEQLAALDWLLVNVVAPRYPVLPNTRHRDISFEGKIDPSDNFPWGAYIGGMKQVVERYIIEKPKEVVELADIETVVLLREQAVHPDNHEVYAIFADEALEDNWLFVGYPHYAPGADAAWRSVPQPDSIEAVGYVTDMNGNIKWEQHVLLGKGVDAGKDRFYHVWRLPELGTGRVQVDYSQIGLGCTPYLRRIRAKQES